MTPETVLRLLQPLTDGSLATSSVIPWSSPVPAFGAPVTAVVATLGLNPSNREFVDERGRELVGSERRFHTLGSLGLASWADADVSHLEMISESCGEYFSRNPYDGWFGRLDQVISGTGASYYNGMFRRACHLDLIPYATALKWSALSHRQRLGLLASSRGSFGNLLRQSQIRVLVLNGSSVVDYFQELTGSALVVEERNDWALPRASGVGVRGVAYSGRFSTLAGVPLGREILVLGYNHNIQSSFGVTKSVIGAIREWVTTSCAGELT